MLVGTATTVAACAFLTAFIPGIGGAVAAGIAGMVGGVCSFYSPELTYGSVISWNYVEGPQEIWVQ